MHRNDNSKYLLYIEPNKSQKNSQPVEDDLTKTMERALACSKSGTASYSDIKDKGTFREGSGYKGFHSTDCGIHSDNQDHLLPNGMITNSLAVFYVRWYRSAIPTSELQKLKQLEEFMKTYKGKPTEKTSTQKNIFPHQSSYRGIRRRR